MKTMKSPAESKDCAFCGVSEGPHRAAEARGAVNHKFSLDGRLAGVERKPDPKPDRVVASADPVVRLLLIEKGIFTYEDLAEAEVRVHGRERVPERP
jgi:hypothetical protein